MTDPGVLFWSLALIAAIGVSTAVGAIVGYAMSESKWKEMVREEMERDDGPDRD